MNEIVPIRDTVINGESVPACDARDVHSYLGVDEKFADWIKRQVKRAHLTQGRDFEVFPDSQKNPEGGRPTVNYVLAIDAAKHIGMMSATEKGYILREFFIEVEKRYRKNAINEQIAGAIAVQVGSAVAAAMVTVVNEIRQSLLPMSNALGEKPGYRTVERALELLGPAALGIDDLDQVTRGERSSLGRAMVKRTKAHKVKVLYTTNALGQRVAMFKAWILDRYFLEEFKRIHGASRRQLALFPTPAPLPEAR